MTPIPNSSANKVLATQAKPAHRCLAILGSTGSIGRNAVEVAAGMPDRIEVVALAAGENWRELALQVERLRPRLVSLGNPAAAAALEAHLRAAGGFMPEILHGEAGMRAVTVEGGADLVLAAVVGVAGLSAIQAALARGCDLALANKEALVVGGELLMAEARRSGARILPVDSEHSAIHQCLRAGNHGEMARLILTASGGPFLRMPASELEAVTADQALRHPTWSMGRRVTLDSATLMNKGFEIIEACWLFDVREEEVEVLIHPQSIVHSLVEFRDGSVIAQLGTADMCTPIQYALTYPDRATSPRMRLNLEQVGRLDFEAPDLKRFPCLRLAREAFRVGGSAPAVLNAADEVAVAAFAAGRLPFGGIARVVAAALDRLGSLPVTGLDALLAADGEARRLAVTLLPTAT